MVVAGRQGIHPTEECLACIWEEKAAAFPQNKSKWRNFTDQFCSLPNLNPCRGKGKFGWDASRDAPHAVTDTHRSTAYAREV